MKMTIHNLVQGSPEWLAHRANTFNASDAPAMLGCSLYSSRAELLQRMHTGLSPDVDAATQRRYDGGHRAEALARPVAAEIIGEDLYPVVGSIAVEGLSRRLGASFDGLTMARDKNWEHKALNDDLRAVFDDIETIAPEHRDEQGGRLLHKHYRVQMEQQLLVGNCERVLFMASKWNGDELVEERHCWYVTDPALRAEIVAGWIQFEKDLAAYVPPERAAVVVATPVQALPAVLVQVSGSIIVTDNFADFQTSLADFLEHRLIREPKTDQDFADLEVQIKAMKGAEAALDAAEDQMLAQIMAVDQAKKTKDMLAKLVRDNRLMAEKLLTSEKERRKSEIVAGGVKALADHIAALNKRIGKPYMPVLHRDFTDFGGAIRGKKNLDNMQDAVDSLLARAKINADEIADDIEANLKYLRERAKDHTALFPDTAQIVLKAPEDLQALATSRIAQHKEAEQRRLDAERQRIREEERDRLAAEQAAQQATQAPAAPQTQPIAAPAPVVAAAPVAANVVPLTRPASPPVDTGARINLSDIKDRLHPIQITAEGLASLGFSHVATEKASKLYRAADFGLICAALVAHIEAVQAKQAA